MYVDAVPCFFSAGDIIADISIALFQRFGHSLKLRRVLTDGACNIHDEMHKLISKFLL